MSESNWDKPPGDITAGVRATAKRLIAQVGLKSVPFVMKIDGVIYHDEESAIAALERCTASMRYVKDGQTEHAPPV